MIAPAKSVIHGNSRRHTCLASVEVSPISNESIDFEILEKDLEITLRCYPILSGECQPPRNMGASVSRERFTY